MIKKFKYETILAIIILIYIGIFSFLSIKRYKTLNSHYYDLGIMDQVVFNTSRGRFLEMTDPQLKKNVNRLAIHFDPILAVFAPFYKIYQGPEVLLIGQTVILALGALAVYLIGQQIIKKKPISLLFAISYLCFFPIQRANIFDFHGVVLATTFLLFAIYFNLVKKNRWSFIFILLSLLTKEHVGLVIFLFGLYLFFIKKEKKFGTVVAGTGIIFFVSTMYLMIPYFRKETHFALRYYKDFLIRDPLLTIKYLLQKDTFDYVLKMIKPNFYSILSPLVLLISLPEWVINIFSSNSNMRSIYFHYNSLIIPFIYYSLILGYKNFNNLVKNSLVKRTILIIFIGFNIYSFYLYNPIPSGFVKEPVIYTDISQEKMKTIKQWQDILKDENIKLATTPKLAPFFTARKYYFNFLYDTAYSLMGYTDEEIYNSKSNDYKMADYVIIDRTEIGDLSQKTLPARFFQNFMNDKDYEVIFSSDQQIEIYKKI